MNESKKKKKQVSFDPPGPKIFSGVKTESMLVCEPCDCTYENLNKTGVRKMCRGQLSAKGRSFSELFDNISFALNVKSLCVVVDGLTRSDAKVYDYTLIRKEQP